MAFSWGNVANALVNAQNMKKAAEEAKLAQASQALKDRLTEAQINNYQMQPWQEMMRQYNTYSNATRAHELAMEEAKYANNLETKLWQEKNTAANNSPENIQKKMFLKTIQGLYERLPGASREKTPPRFSYDENGNVTVIPGSQSEYDSIINQINQEMMWMNNKVSSTGYAGGAGGGNTASNSSVKPEIDPYGMLNNAAETYSKSVGEGGIITTGADAGAALYDFLTQGRQSIAEREKTAKLQSITADIKKFTNDFTPENLAAYKQKAFQEAISQGVVDETQLESILALADEAWGNIASQIKTNEENQARAATARTADRAKTQEMLDYALEAEQISNFGFGEGDEGFGFKDAFAALSPYLDKMKESIFGRTGQTAGALAAGALLDSMLKRTQNTPMDMALRGAENVTSRASNLFNGTFSPKIIDTEFNPVQESYMPLPAGENPYRISSNYSRPLALETPDVSNPINLLPGPINPSQYTGGNGISSNGIGTVMEGGLERPVRPFSNFPINEARQMYDEQVRNSAKKEIGDYYSQRARYGAELDKDEIATRLGNAEARQPWLEWMNMVLQNPGILAAIVGSSLMPSTTATYSNSDYDLLRKLKEAGRK